MYVLKFETKVRMMRTLMDFIFWNGRTEIFLQLIIALNNYKFLYENTRILIYREK